jgi:hypothetical protein
MQGLERCFQVSHLPRDFHLALRYHNSGIAVLHSRLLVDEKLPGTLGTMPLACFQ